MRIKSCLVVLIALTLTRPSLGADDLLPPDMNPVQAGIPAPPLVVRALEIFDSEAISKRHHDHVDPLDGFTFTMAHIPQAQVEGFFRDMRNAGGGEVAVAFGARAAEFFANDDKAWSAAIHAARLGAVGKATAADVERVLDATIFSKHFMARYAKNCRITCQPGEPDLYHEQREWLVPLLRLALRDRRVATFQLENWNATLLVPAAANARLAGIDSEAGIISVASAQSSATSWGRQIARAAETGRLAVGDLVWPWNHHPFKPEATAAELHDWRVLATWQWYCAKKRGIRNRSVAYFNAFLKDKWELPTFDGGSKGLKDPANWDPTKVKMKR